MILPKALALSVQLITLVATGDRVPQLDVEPVCKGIAEQGGVTFRDPAVPQEKKNCIESELTVREELVKQWSSFSTDDRTHCINETTMGGESSYTELLTCLEMARDVRAMRAEAQDASRAAATRAPSSRRQAVQPAPAEADASRAAATRAPSSPSTPTVQPAPAEPASRPTSANEPSKFKDDSTLIEKLQVAKADAQNATASEALAQRKLADVEAALQRTKAEAERATNEAQRAKADAQAARASEAAAKRKLADAEAARTAAEACQSAAKSKPGFGARLRGWILQHYP
jgi:hypothetical protein